MANLKSQFGAKYRLAIEEGGDKADPTALIILCRHGHIYTHGPKRLGAATNCRGSIAKRLAALQCVTLWQDGSDGLNVTFDVGDFDTVAAVMLPRTRRRKLTPQEKERLAASNQHCRFRPAVPDGGQEDAAS